MSEDIKKPEATEEMVIGGMVKKSSLVKGIKAALLLAVGWFAGKKWG